MFCDRKIFLWFLVFASVFSCRSSTISGEEVSPQSFNLTFSREAVFFLLPFSFDVKKDKQLSKYSLYGAGDYQSIVRKGFPSKGDDEAQYLYIRSLYHLKEWDKLIQALKLFDSKSQLYPYIVFYGIQAATEKKQYFSALDSYKKNQKLLEAIPFPEEIEEQYHKILARLRLKNQATDLGKYYYSVYEEDGDRNPLLQAVLLGDRRAIGELNSKNLKKIIPQKDMAKAAEVLKIHWPYLAVKLYEQLKNNQAAGEIYFKLKQYGSALTYLKKDSLQASFCRLKLQKADEKDIEKAKNNLEEGISYLAGYYVKRKKYEEAARLLTVRYSSGFIREMILDLLNEKNYKRLIGILETLSQASMNDEEKTMVFYWLGHLLIKANEKDKADNYLKYAAFQYPFHYYGWQAYHLLKNKEEAVKNWTVLFDENLKKQKDLFNHYKNNLEFPEKAKVGLFFLKINESQKGMAELKKHLGNIENYYPAFIRFFKSIEREDMVIRYATLLYRAINEKTGNAIFYENLLRELFPLKYKELIDLAAGKYSLPSSLIAGIIRQESNFYYKAVSWVGAKGLMQLMPATAKPLLKKLAKSKASENISIIDPKCNILSGSMHFQWLYGQMFSENTEPYRSILSVASYNAGATRIRKLYKSRSDWSPTYFIESIYLDETRDYVKRVMVYKEFYKRLYGI